MARLIYMAITSLDGYIEDDTGHYGWAMPDDEVFAFVNDFERPVGTYLYGRRLYEEMAGWETAGDRPGQAPLVLDFAGSGRPPTRSCTPGPWTMPLPPGPDQRRFDPEAVRRMEKPTAGTSPWVVRGFGHAITAGLVNEYHLVISPIVLGSGKPALPGVRLPLELLAERRFGSGVVHLHYRNAPASS